MTKPSDEDVESIGGRIRRFREEAGLSLSKLAEKAELSKGYLSRLENGVADARPSGKTLYALAQALGVTMSDLLGRKLLSSAQQVEIPPTLRDFAQETNLPEADVQMLASIEFRGEPPRTKERWNYIYTAIQTSASLDARTRRTS